MDEFIYIPDWNAQGATKANVSKVQFADGYVQRQTKGANPLGTTWNLAFSARTRTEALAIEQFLKDRYGVIAFTWTPPGGDQAKWTCETWNRTEVGNQVNNLTCTFELVYEP